MVGSIRYRLIVSRLAWCPSIPLLSISFISHSDFLLFAVWGTPYEQIDSRPNTNLYQQPTTRDTITQVGKTRTQMRDTGSPSPCRIVFTPIVVGVGSVLCVLCLCLFPFGRFVLIERAENRTKKRKKKRKTEEKANAKGKRKKEKGMGQTNERLTSNPTNPANNEPTNPTLN